ncbi:MAG: glutaredoxin domain-containing protein, partial [Saprospiraceae bacterium]
STQMNMNKINVFTKNGCGRCEFTIKYLQENNIPYVELNTSMHQPNNDLMWEQLEKTDHNSKSVQLPVIVQNGRVYQNIESLPALLKSFK